MSRLACEYLIPNLSSSSTPELRCLRSAHVREKGCSRKLAQERKQDRKISTALPTVFNIPDCTKRSCWLQDAMDLLQSRQIGEPQRRRLSSQDWTSRRGTDQLTNGMPDKDFSGFPVVRTEAANEDVTCDAINASKVLSGNSRMFSAVALMIFTPFKSSQVPSSLQGEAQWQQSSIALALLPGAQ